MLYNKNNVRKTNDKKILHKVGKQWKVVSVALLMAIGGGAAVATHANAQSNNGVNASTSAEVTALEQKPAVPSAVSSAPSSVAPSSASAKPSSAISYQNGYNGSAASYHAKALSDNAGFKVNNATVKSYVNSLNSAFPSATNSLNNNYTSAATKTAADQAAAQSYSAIANNKNYSSQVSTLASKAGLTYSGFVQSVSYQASNYANAVSSDASLNNQMSTVNSYAQLINNIDNNSALSQEYSAKSVSASANFKVANDAKVAANSVYNHFISASATYQDAINTVRAQSASNSDAEGIALVYAGLDATTTNSLANSLGFTNSSATSSYTHVLADNEAALNNYENGSDAYYYSRKVSGHVPVFVQSASNNVSGNNAASEYSADASAAFIAGNSDAVNSYQDLEQSTLDSVASADAMFTLFSDTSQEDQYNAASAAYNSELASYATDSASVSNAIVSASSALTSASNKLASAQSDYDAYNILGNHPNLGELFAPEVEVTASATSSAINASNATSAAYASALNIIKGLDPNYEADAVVHNVIKALPSSVAGVAPNVVSAVNTKVSSALAQKANSPVVKYAASIANNPVANKADMTLISNAAKNGALKNVSNANELASVATNYGKHGVASELSKNASSADALITTLGGVTNAVNYASTLASNLGVVVPHAASAASVNYGSLAIRNDLAQKLINKGVPVKEAMKAGSYAANGNGMTDSDAINAAKSDASVVVNSAMNDLQSLAKASASASAVVSNEEEAQSSVASNSGILNPNNYSYAKVAINGNYNASSINSLANSAAAAYTNVESASTAYSAATEENITLAGIYANSYSVNANSDEAVESAAKTSLDDFYANHADAKYANASSAAASYAAAEPNDAALAHANGVHVYNYAPKYVRVIRNGVLHSNTEYSKRSAIVSVPKGTQLTVLGVGFANDGTTRYAVKFNGKKGYFTANDNYVAPAFLPAANGVSVTTNRAVKLYKNAKFTKKAGKTLPAGTTVPNVDVVSEDSIYGGFTRVETPSGDFFTANSLYVGLTGAANDNTGINDNNANINNNTNNGSNNGANNGVGFWN